jgi:superfamily II DNA or RNA helicase
VGARRGDRGGAAALTNEGPALGDLPAERRGGRFHGVSVDGFIRQYRGWEPFFAAVSHLPKSAPGGSPDKGKVFERLTQLYLRTSPEYQSKLKHVWRAKEELPPDVRAKTSLPPGDEGIDLVAQTFGGEFWAIQCKFRTETHRALTVGELATFANLSFNVCREFSLAVVAHTAAKPIHKRKLLPRTTEIGLDRWLALDDEGWQRIHAATSKEAPRPKPRNPRPHQQEAIKAAREHFAKGKNLRGRMIMPCGTGKSLTAFWIAQSLKPRSILVAVPSLALIKQSLTDWTREFLAHGEVPDWLCVCSDETTGNLDRDEFVGEVYELGVDATTDPSEIAHFLAAKNARRRIIFATYQSGAVLAKAARRARFQFDLGIMDEAHRTVGSQEKAFAQLLFDRNLRIRRRLFMTATERVVRGADDEVVSMDDPNVYGERFHQLSFKEAVEARPPIISDYKILTITVTDTLIHDLIRKNRYLRTLKKLGEREAQALAAGITLQRAFKERGVGHAISFHRSIRAADEFRDQHEKIVVSDRRQERPVCFHVSSHKTTGERSQLLREFRQSPKGLITNARCLQEGVDIPAVDCVLFADPKQSVVDIIQAAGRAMRPYPGKRFGYIVVPIIVPSGMHFSTFAETTEFKQVARVITALSTQDGRIAEELRAIGEKRRGDGRIVEISGEVPVGYRISLDEFRERIRLKVWERVGVANWRPFEEARAFARGLGLRNAEEWFAYSSSDKCPPDIPTTPSFVYRDRGFAGFGDWLGTGRVYRGFRPFRQARAFVRRLGVKSGAQWNAFCKSGRRPQDIPVDPAMAYRDMGWEGMGDWLGTGVVATRDRAYRPFGEARAFARSLALKSATEWRDFCKTGKRPPDIPAAPWITYHDQGWVSFGDWFGTGTVSNRDRKFRPFRQARRFVHSLGLKSQAEWFAYLKTGRCPRDIPTNPQTAYRGRGWASLGDWFGTGTVSNRDRKFRPFRQARAFVRRLGLKSQPEWFAYCTSGNCPPDIPSNPHRTYRDRGWASFGDWLGTGSVSNRDRKFRPFRQAHAFSRSLGLTNEADWRAYSKSGKRPPDVPAAPWKTYKDRGWRGWADWLGPSRSRKGTNRTA